MKAAKTASGPRCSSQRLPCGRRGRPGAARRRGRERPAGRPGRSRTVAVTRGSPAVRGTPRPTAPRSRASKRMSGSRGNSKGTSTAATMWPGPGRHDQHPARQEHRLLDGVGDEQSGEALVQEEALELVVEALAGDLVEGAERLVEEEQRRVERERTGQRHPHLHAAREPLRVALLEAPQSHQLDRLGHLAGALGAVHAVQLAEQLDVALHGAPGQQRGVLEHVADVAVRQRRCARSHPGAGPTRVAARSTCRSPRGRRS